MRRCVCRAIADTPFPFPWAQSVLILLILYAISVPLIVVAFINSTWQGLVVNFLCVQSYWCLNEVARDLEDPFVYDPNDLPLSRYQVWEPSLLGSLMTSILHMSVVLCLLLCCKCLFFCMGLKARV